MRGVTAGGLKPPSPNVQHPSKFKYHYRLQNNIGAPKKRKIRVIFSKFTIAIFNFSLLLLFKIIAFYLLSFIFGIIFVACFTISIVISLKDDSDKFSLLLAIAFKSEKERQLFLSRQLEEQQLYREKYRKEAMKQCIQTDTKS